MATLTQMRTDLGDRADTIVGLNVYDRLPDLPETPAANVALHSIEWELSARGTFGGAGVYTFRVLLLVGRADSDEAQRGLDAYLAEGSALKAALEDTSTNNTSGMDWAIVTGVRDFGVYDYGGMELYGCQVEVQVAV